jgi:hypothetical protein
MKLKKGSAAAKAYMAKIRAKRGKKAAPKKAAVGKYKKGKTTFVEVGEKKPKGKAVRVIRRKTAGKPGTFRDFVKIAGVDTMPYVKVMFANSKYNYTTSVSKNITKADAEKYFVGKYFNLGTGEKDNLQKCIKIQFYEVVSIK